MKVEVTRECILALEKNSLSGMLGGVEKVSDDLYIIDLTSDVIVRLFQHQRVDEMLSDTIIRLANRERTWNA